MTETRARRLGLLLAAGDAALLLAYGLYALTGGRSWTLGTLGRLFDLDAEATIPAWYSSAQLLLTGVLLVWTGANTGSVSDALHPSTTRRPAPVSGRFLVVVGLGFCFLSADEVAGIHETITIVLRPFQSFPRFAGDHGIWIPIYLSLGTLFLLGTLRHWRALWRAERQATTWIVVGVLLFLGGGVGLEALSYGRLREGPRGGLYLMQVAAEEGLELFGATTMLVGTMLLAVGRIQDQVSPRPGG